MLTAASDVLQPKGGLRDKPGKPPDFYHTCYCLSGLAAAQQYSGVVLGPATNALPEADPLCNVLTTKLAAARLLFGNGVNKNLYAGFDSSNSFDGNS